MSRFIAVPVGQGDAFHLESEGWSVLVDGGRSRYGFASAFQTATEADGASVVVCTHNDADHTDGIIGFLEAGFKCGELWLPGRWLGALPSVLRPFVEVFEDLVNSFKERDAGVSSIEAYAEQLDDSSNEVSTTEKELSVGEDGWPEQYIHLLEQAQPWEIWPMYCPWPEGWLWPKLHRLRPSDVQLLWSAIEAAGRIRAIAIEAFHRGIPVRWFEFDTVDPKIGNLPLQPLNARLIALVRPLVGPLLNLLALTVSNKESLVFWYPPNDKHPGVLFTADSDLTGISLPGQLQNVLATAPHHGSEENAKAYRKVNQKANSVTWVRSDGRYQKRPGQTYLSLASPRFCTLCRSPSCSKQAVHLVVQGGAWTPQGTRLCQCR